MTTTRTYAVRITGESPLLLHNDDVAWSEQMKRWETDPENRKSSVKGDDRSPAYRWIGCIYHDRKHVGIPSDNLMTTIREGATKVGTGQRGATFKKLSQSGMLVNEIQWDILTPKGKVSYADIYKLMPEADFAAHEERAKELGFTLFVKRARVGASKHVRVRPRFDDWQAAGTITVLEESITTQVLTQILDCAGRMAGLGDWRPSSPRAPGPFGKFSVEVEQVA